MILISAPKSMIDSTDLLWGSLNEEIKLGKEPDVCSQGIPLYSINPNPIWSLSKLNIDNSLFEKTRYTCPYTNFKCYGIVPTALFSDDLSKYSDVLKENHQPSEYILDYEWHKEMDEDFVKLTKIQSLMLGSGYIYGCGANDGSSKIIPASLELDNGDQLYVHVWRWSNK